MMRMVIFFCLLLVLASCQRRSPAQTQPGSQAVSQGKGIPDRPTKKSGSAQSAQSIQQQRQKWELEHSESQARALDRLLRRMKEVDAGVTAGKAAP
jgi:hypothetical protein